MLNNSDSLAYSVDISSLKRTVSATFDAVNEVSAMIDVDGPFCRSFERAVETISTHRTGRVVVCGVGKSGHVGRKIAATLASTGTHSFFVHPTEASHGDLGMISSEDILVLLSWSGETAELANVLGYARRFDIPVIAVTSCEGSVLGRNADIVLCLPQVQEACPNGLAPTTSTLLQLLIGDALAVALLERRGFTPQDFRVFHPGGKLGAQLMRICDICHVGKKMPLVPWGTLMSDAVVEMSSKGFGVVGVLDESQHLIGIITDGDLRRHMSSNLMDLRVEAVMSQNPFVVEGGLLAAAAMKLLQDQKITVVFVVEETMVPRGIVHLHDLLRAGVA